MESGEQITGPLIDTETGVRMYRVVSGGKTAEFGVIPVQGEDGVTHWTMRTGEDRVVPGDYSSEPYETSQEAYEAGVRASRVALGLPL